MQNNSELELHHIKRGREDRKGKLKARRQRVCQSMYTVTENIFPPF
jgi:hypothetical protein